MIIQAVVYLITLILKKLIETDLSKQQALDGDPKAIQQVNFTGDLERAGNSVFQYWKSKRNHFGFFTRNCESIINLFSFNIM